MKNASFSYRGTVPPNQHPHSRGIENKKYKNNNLHWIVHLVFLVFPFISFSVAASGTVRLYEKREFFVLRNRPPEAGEGYFASSGESCRCLDPGGTVPESKMRCILLHRNRPRVAALGAAFNFITLQSYQHFGHL